jgi:hypothetical protein
MYKGHSSRAAYLKWCQEQWNKNHEARKPVGDKTLSQFVDEISEAGACGTCDIVEAGGGGSSGQQVLIFAYILPVTPEKACLAFAEALAKAVTDGYLPPPVADLASYLGEQAPCGNTGLTSPQPAN